MILPCFVFHHLFRSYSTLILLKSVVQHRQGGRIFLLYQDDWDFFCQIFFDFGFKNWICLWMFKLFRLLFLEVSLSESFIPAFRVIKLFLRVHSKVFHYLFSLFDNYPSFGIRILANEGGQNFFHFWEGSLPSSFLLVDLDPSIPSLEVFAVHT